MPKQTFDKQRGASSLFSFVAFALFLAIIWGVYLLFELDNVRALGIHFIPGTKNFSKEEKKALLEKLESLRKE